GFVGLGRVGYERVGHTAGDGGTEHDEPQPVAGDPPDVSRRSHLTQNNGRGPATVTTACTSVCDFFLTRLVDRVDQWRGRSRLPSRRVHAVAHASAAPRATNGAAGASGRRAPTTSPRRWPARSSSRCWRPAARR